LSDTVGFIRKLPHDLVEAFKATLEEVVRADLLLHVVDASHPHCDRQIESVHTVLHEIGAGGKPTLMIFNKMDQAEGPTIQRLLTLHHPSVAISAQTGEGIPDLLNAIGAELRPIREFLELNVPHHASDVIARLHSVGQVLERDYDGETARFRACIPPHLHAEFAPFIVPELQKA
jgi:GTP-binding protein HflX